MHRAGVDGPFRRIAILIPSSAIEVFLGFGCEPAATPGGTEVIGASRVRMTVLRRMRIDRHSTDWIDTRIVAAPLVRQSVLVLVQGERHYFNPM
jgi:hypothetical protein